MKDYHSFNFTLPLHIQNFCTIYSHLHTRNGMTSTYLIVCPFNILFIALSEIIQTGQMEEHVIFIFAVAKLL